jgi:hypothetical protein
VVAPSPQGDNTVRSKRENTSVSISSPITTITV